MVSKRCPVKGRTKSVDFKKEKANKKELTKAPHPPAHQAMCSTPRHVL